MLTDEIILEIEDTPIVCKKQLLIRNSDYFKAMFEDNFREKNMPVIKLEGVELKAMKVIVTLLNDETYRILDEDILMVLEAACMLQFTSIARWCVETLKQVLSTKNCLEVWLVTAHLSITSISLKAKYIALNKFMEVRKNEYIQKLTIGQLCDYVGNVYLITECESFVFHTVMMWWCKNSSNFYKNATETLLKLLSCIDYRNLSAPHFETIINHPEILANDTIKDTMMCLLSLKTGSSTTEYKQSSQCNALLLNSCKSRVPSSCPCILVRSVNSANSKKNDEVRFPGTDNRQGDYLTVKEPNRTESCVVYYDKNSNNFKKFFSIDNDKCHNLEGFKLVGYKGCALMYGGQYKIGSGLWNLKFWMYDIIKEEWSVRTDMPFRRSHFESCIAGDRVYILGGIGNFRIRIENLYWYNLSTDKWSLRIVLPSRERQLKCCEFMNDFVAFNVDDRCGYFYTSDVDKLNWTIKQFIIEDGILDDEPIFKLVSHKDKLYIKGKKLIEFGMRNDNMEILSVKNITNIDYDAIEAIVCSDVIYTLYKYHNVAKTLYSFEKYSIKTGDIEYVFKDRCVFDIDGESLEISSNMKVFSINHYSLLESNDLINHSYM